MATRIESMKRAGSIMLSWSENCSGSTPKQKAATFIVRIMDPVVSKKQQKGQSAPDVANAVVENLCRHSIKLFVL